MRISLRNRLTSLSLASVAFLTTLALFQTLVVQRTSAVTGPVVSVDTIPDASNTATTVGTIEPCQTTTGGSSFNIDIAIQDVTGISGFQADLLYDPAIVHVTGVDYRFLLASTLAAVVDVGDLVPDTDGTFFVGAVQFPLVPAVGSGVLVRVTLQAVGVGGSALDLANVKLADGSGNPIQPSDSSTHFYLGPINAGSVSVGSVCGPDSDGDGLPDSVDNCPSWANPSQVLPNWAVPSGDSDCDGFPDTIPVASPNALSSEASMGTDPARHCAADNTRNNEASPDAWPVDFDDNQAANGSDLLMFAPVFGAISPNPLYSTRFDLNSDGRINGSDILKFAPFFGKHCA